MCKLCIFIKYCFNTNNMYFIIHLLIADNFKAIFMISESVFCIITFEVIIYLQAKEAESRGVLAEARQKRNAALICNITACVWWVIALILIVVPIAVIATHSSSSSSSDYNYNYNYNDYNYYSDNNYYYYNYNDYNYYYYNYYSGYSYCFDCYK